MLKLPLTFFAVFSLFSSLAAAQVTEPQHDRATPVVEESQDPPPSVVATAGVVTVPDTGATAAVEGRIVDQLYLGAMGTFMQGDEGWILGGPRVSYRIDVRNFTLAPFVAVVGVWGGRLSNDERGRRAETVTALGGGQLTAHFGPAMVGVEGAVMPLRVTESAGEQEDPKPADEQRWDVLATVAGVAGARF